MNIQKIENLKELKLLKRAYVDSATAPLDGMWLCGFVPMAEHFGFYENDELVGFCCLNSEAYLLQFYICPKKRHSAEKIFNRLFEEDALLGRKLAGAFVSTAESEYLALCLDHFSDFKVNALMYQYREEENFIREQPLFRVTLADTAELELLVQFSEANIGAPKEWLTGYYSNLIAREELFVYRDQENIIALGEIRGRDDYQKDYADLGFIVAENQRGQGLGTAVMKELIWHCREKNLKPVCSTEKNNLSAQKALSRAGFFAPHRILQFDNK